MVALSQQLEYKQLLRATMRPPSLLFSLGSPFSSGFFPKEFYHLSCSHSPRSQLRDRFKRAPAVVIWYGTPASRSGSSLNTSSCRTAGLGRAYPVTIRLDCATQKRCHPPPLSRNLNIMPIIVLCSLRYLLPVAFAPEQQVQSPIMALC